MEEAEELNKHLMDTSLQKADAFKTLDQSAGEGDIALVQDQLKFKKRAKEARFGSR